MTLTRILVTVLALISISAQARMYQWIDPESGTTQLSGKPPAWYRSEDGGPRVIVFDKGKIIDDTSIDVSDEERESLRLQALLKVEQDQDAARKKLLETEQIKAKLDNPAAKNEQGTQTEVSETPPAETKPAAEEPGEQTAPANPEEEKMRKLISDWEKLMDEQAKKEAGNSYMGIKERTQNAEQQSGSDYIRMENKSSE